MSARQISLRAGLAFLFLAGLHSSALSQQCGPEAVTNFGTWFSPATTPLRSDHQTEMVVPDQQLNTSSMKLLLGITAGTDRDFNVVVRDSNFRVLATFGAGDFLNDHGLGQRRWTGRLFVSRARIDLVSHPNSDIRVEVLSGISYAGETSDVRLFSIVSTEGEPWRELHEKNEFVLAKRAGDSVGMLVAGATNVLGSKRSWCCSGVMVSADVMLTNWHCGGSRDLQMSDQEYWRSDVCENSVVDLGWAKGAPTRQYSCSRVLAKDKSLDYALIRLRPIVGSGAGTGTPVRARLAESAAKKNQDIFVVHHAKCAEKLVSDRCRVQSAAYRGWQVAADAADFAIPQTDLTDFTHNCNTEQGASGAPVFDLTTGTLVGLHHTGVRRDAQCNRLDDVNKAVSIFEIRKHLRAKKPDVAAEIWPN